MKDKIFGVLQTRGTQLYATHCTVACAGLAGHRQLVHQRNDAGGLWLEQCHPSGTFLRNILDVMSQTGNAVFNNLALLSLLHGRSHRHGSRKEKDNSGTNWQWPISIRIQPFRP